MPANPEGMLPSPECEQLRGTGSAAATATSFTDWLCSALLGRPWLYLTGTDLLPASEDQLPDTTADEDPEFGDVEVEGGTRASVLYAKDGRHGMSGYHVKTVGNAPVAVPQPLSTAEQARARAEATIGSAWNAGGGTWETRDTTAWATSRLPSLFVADGRSASAKLEVTGGDASVAIVRG